MTEMSMLETLHLWNEGVTAMDKGDYESTLAYFESLKGRTDSSQMLITAARNLFNIGKAYLNLGMLPEATEVHVFLSTLVYQPSFDCVFKHSSVDFDANFWRREMLYYCILTRTSGSRSLKFKL